MTPRRFINKMKRIKKLCTAALLIWWIQLSPAAAAIRIGVDRFRSGAPGVSRATASALTEMFITELSNSGSFQVYERTALEKIAREQRLSMSGMVSDSSLVKAGRLAGVECIITGAVTQFDEQKTGGVLPIHNFGLIVGSNVGTVTLDVRIVDTTTGAITAALRETGSASRAITGAVYEGTVIGTTQYGGVGSQAAMKAVKRIVRELERRVGGVAYHVIKVTPQHAFIDMGSAKGAAQGQLYGVYEEGELIRALDGSIIDAEKIYHALIKVVEVKPNYSLCAYVKDKGGPASIRTGDLLDEIEAGASARSLPVVERPIVHNTPDFLTAGIATHCDPNVHDASPSSPQKNTARKGSAQRLYADKGGPVFKDNPDVNLDSCTDEQLFNAYNMPANRLSNLRIIYRNGQRYYKAGQYSNAYSMFNRSVCENSFDLLNTYWAGMSALKCGNMKNARTCFDAVLAINPAYQPAQKALKKLR